MRTFIQSLRYVDKKSSHHLSTAGQISFGHLYQSLQIFCEGKKISVLLQQHRSYCLQGEVASWVLSCSGLHGPGFRRWRPKNNGRSVLGRFMVLVTCLYVVKYEGS